MHISLQNFGFDNTLKCFMASGYYEFSSRMHQFLEIQYIMEGTLDITVEGKRKTLTSGDFAIIPPFCEHSFICSNDAKRWILIPSNSYISDFLSDEVLITGGEDFSFKASDGLAHYVKENLLDFGDVTVDLDKDKQLMLTVKSLAYPILNEYLKKIPQVIKNKKSSS